MSHSNSVESLTPVRSYKVESGSVAPLFGKAIRRAHQREGISVN